MNQTHWRTLMDEARTPRSLAGWRVVIGEIGEQIAAEALNCRRLSTCAANNPGECDWYCPDLTNGIVDFEVKTCGISNAVIIYQVRLLKDREYSATRPLCYCIVKHFCTVPQLNALEARAVMLETARIFVLPFRYIDGICETIRPKILNKKYKPSNGWCQRGYNKGGYLIPWRALEPYAMEIRR